MDDNLNAKQILTSSSSSGRGRRSDHECSGWTRRGASNPTSCHGLSQLTWPRTDSSVGCWRAVLCTRSCPSRTRRWCWCR